MPAPCRVLTHGLAILPRNRAQCLALATQGYHIAIMKLKERWYALGRSPTYRLAMAVFGVALLLTSPLVGFLPGPGGIFVFAIGLGLILRSSLWAKRHYVVFKRKRPKIGHWADWGLRRRSARRRIERRKQKEKADN